MRVTRRNRMRREVEIETERMDGDMGWRWRNRDNNLDVDRWSQRWETLGLSSLCKAWKVYNMVHGTWICGRVHCTSRGRERVLSHSRSILYLPIFQMWWMLKNGWRGTPWQTKWLLLKLRLEKYEEIYLLRLLLLRLTICLFSFDLHSLTLDRYGCLVWYFPLIRA